MGLATDSDPSGPSSGAAPLGAAGSASARPGREGAGPRLVAALLAVLAAPLLSAGTCVPTLEDPLQLDAAMAPFERYPYVQAVDTSSAWIVWLADSGAADSALYRLVGEAEQDEGAWRSARVERDPLPATDGGERLARRRIHLAGLPPGADVEYVVWADSIGQGPIRFRTAPRPAEADTTRALVFGDSGWGSQAQLRLAGLMASEPADLVLHTGDIAYHVGSEEDFTIRHFRVYRSLLARRPFFPAPGNHDLRTDGGAPYDRAFVWPAPTEEARYYAFRWGRTLFVALDTTDEDLPDFDYPPEILGEIEARREDEEDDAGDSAGGLLREGRGPEYDWLVETLEAARLDPGVKWIVVYMHHPIYSHATGFSGHGADGRLRRVLVPLFDRYGVDLVLAGHDHHYERTFPTRDSDVVEPGCGPVYVVTGGGGASRFARGIAVTPLLDRSSRDYHYIRLTIVDTGIIAEVIGVFGQLIDRFLVVDWAGEEDPPAASGCGLP